MKKVYKAHILFTKEKDRFEVYENGYIAVEDGIVKGVASNLSDLDAADAVP
jgi:guanine deaminase